MRSVIALAALAFAGTFDSVVAVNPLALPQCTNSGTRPPLTSVVSSYTRTKTTTSSLTQTSPSGTRDTSVSVTSTGTNTDTTGTSTGSNTGSVSSTGTRTGTETATTPATTPFTETPTTPSPGPRTVTNEVKNGNFAKVNPDGTIPNWETENEAYHEYGPGYQGDGSRDQGCVAMRAESDETDTLEKRALGPFAGLSQGIYNLNTQTLYTIRFFYAVVTAPTQGLNLCRLDAYLGGRNFYTTFIFSMGMTMQWDTVLTQVPVSNPFAPLAVSVQCYSGGIAFLYVDSFFMSNQVTPANINDFILDYGDDETTGPSSTSSATTPGVGGTSSTSGSVSQTGGAGGSGTASSGASNSGTATSGAGASGTASSGASNSGTATSGGSGASNTASSGGSGASNTASSGGSGGSNTGSATGTASSGASNTGTATGGAGNSGSASSGGSGASNTGSSGASNTGTATSGGSGASNTGSATGTTTGTAGPGGQTGTSTTTNGGGSGGSSSTTSGGIVDPTAVSRICANVGNSDISGRLCNVHPTSLSGVYHSLPIGPISKEECAAVCLSESRCKSFSWKYGTDNCGNECHLSDSELTAATVGAVGSTYDAYDRSCAWTIPCFEYPENGLCLNRLGNTPSSGCSQRPGNLKDCALPMKKFTIYPCGGHDACRSQCLMYVGCKSFTYADVDEQDNCVLYSGITEQIADVGSDLYFEDLSCYTCGENMGWSTYGFPADDNWTIPDMDCPLPSGASSTSSSSSTTTGTGSNTATSPSITGTPGTPTTTTTQSHTTTTTGGTGAYDPQCSRYVNPPGFCSQGAGGNWPDSLEGTRYTGEDEFRVCNIRGTKYGDIQTVSREDFPMQDEHWQCAVLCARTQGCKASGLGPRNPATGKTECLLAKTSISYDGFMVHNGDDPVWWTDITCWNCMICDIPWGASTSTTTGTLTGTTTATTTSPGGQNPGSGSSTTTTATTPGGENPGGDGSTATTTTGTPGGETPGGETPGGGSTTTTTTTGTPGGETPGGETPGGGSTTTTTTTGTPGGETPGGETPGSGSTSTTTTPGSTNPTPPAELPCAAALDQGCTWGPNYAVNASLPCNRNGRFEAEDTFTLSGDDFPAQSNQERCTALCANFPADCKASAWNSELSRCVFSKESITSAAFAPAAYHPPTGSLSWKEQSCISCPCGASSGGDVETPGGEEQPEGNDNEDTGDSESDPLTPQFCNPVPRSADETSTKVCGLHGTQSSGILIGGGDSGGPTDCAQTCLSTDDCRTFEFDGTYGECRMYSNRPSEIGLTADPSVMGAFWDRDCYQCPSVQG